MIYFYLANSFFIYQINCDYFLINSFMNQEEIYKFNPKDIENIYSIDTPPPTVSGHLHMGHVFSYCHADFIARFQRMQGKNVFYPIGFDDNGLPTERLVEKITGVRVGFNYNEKSKQILLELTGENYHGTCTKQDFVEICRKVVEEAEVEFEKLFKSINLSVDWDYKYQSISQNSEKIAQTAFVNLWEKGLIYNKYAPVYWCCQDKTATANTEIEEKEMPGIQIEFKWKSESGLDLTVMTTRPEMLPACRALLFNPEDERFNGKKTGQKIIKKLADGSEISSIGIDLNGKFAIVPISGQKVPILPDEDVKMDKGTGLVMCCTYGDWQDVIWAKRHNLEEEIIISEDGKIGDLKIEDARKKAVEILEEQGLLISKKEIQHSVKCAERSGKPLEIIPAEQWYVKVMPFKKVLLEMSKLVKFHPENMRIKLENWINGLSQDWCISRNRFFGISIPMEKKCNDLDGKNNQYFPFALGDIAKLPTGAMMDNPWVLDTWFTSGLSPHLSSILHENLNSDCVLDLKNNKIRKENGEIMSLRPQAHEIIRTWTFTTLVQHYFNLATEITDEISDFDIQTSENPIEFGEKDYVVIKTDKAFLKCHRPKKAHLPWENVMLSGWCLASDKTKMSKSKGNIVTPVPLVEEHGADAVRYWSGSSTLGADTAYNEASLKDAKRLITKLKNAAKLCLQTIEKSQILGKSHDDIIELTRNIKGDIDRAILVKISNIFKEYCQYMANYEYSKALDCVEKFFWSDFCDNYLELSKVRSYGLDAQIYADKTPSDIEKTQIIDGQTEAACAMYFVISKILMLFAPFLTKTVDEIYINSTLNKKNLTSLHQRGVFAIFPVISIENQDLLLEKWSSVIEIINAIRKAKSDANVSLKTEVKSVIIPSRIGEIFEDGLHNFNGIMDICNAGIILNKSVFSIGCENNIDVKLALD